jgi:hypothetical protein
MPVAKSYKFIETEVLSPKEIMIGFLWLIDIYRKENRKINVLLAIPNELFDELSRVIGKSQVRFLKTNGYFNPGPLLSITLYNLDGIVAQWDGPCLIINPDVTTLHSINAIEKISQLLVIYASEWETRLWLKKINAVNIGPNYTHISSTFKE